MSELSLILTCTVLFVIRSAKGSWKAEPWLARFLELRPVKKNFPWNRTSHTHQTWGTSQGTPGWFVVSPHSWPSWADTDSCRWRHLFHRQAGHRTDSSGHTHSTLYPPSQCNGHGMDKSWYHMELLKYENIVYSINISHTHTWANFFQSQFFSNARFTDPH